MPRKPRIPGIGREAVPAAPQIACEGFCFDMECPRCWGDFLAGVTSTDRWWAVAMSQDRPIHITVDLDDETYGAIQAEATSHGAAVVDVMRAVLRQWAGRKV